MSILDTFFKALWAVILFAYAIIIFRSCGKRSYDHAMHKYPCEPIPGRQIEARNLLITRRTEGGFFMKRIISLILCLAMLTGLSAVAFAEEPVTLKVMFYTNALTKDFNNVAFIQNMAKEANVNLEIEQISSGWDEIKSTLLASGVDCILLSRQ